MPRSERDQAVVTAVRRHRMWRIVLIVVAAAALIVIAIVSRRTLAESLTTLGNLRWPWFLLALVFEAVSLSAFGLSRRTLLQAEGDRAPFGSVMAITYAGNALSMSVPFAGTQLAAVFTYREFRRRGIGPAVTGWALAVSAILSTSALALVLVIGAFAGGASAATAAGFVGAAVFTMPALGVLLALRYQRVRRTLHRVISRLIRLSQRFFRWPHFSADGVEEFLDRVASIKLPWPRYAEAFALAVVNWLADCGCLACAILATGHPVPWRSLLLVYGAGAAVGSTGVTPGGFALVEVTLTAALTAAGLDSGHALGAVLAYRLINFWLILIGGWIMLPFITHRRVPATAATPISEDGARSAAGRTAPGQPVPGQAGTGGNGPAHRARDLAPNRAGGEDATAGPRRDEDAAAG